MFNARDLLGNMMQTGMPKSAPDRISHGMGPQGLGRSGSPLGDLLGNVLGGGGAGAGAAGGGLGGLAGALGGLLGQAGGTSGGAGGGLGGIAGQAGEMLRGPGGKDALAMGGLASLAGAVLGGRSAGMGGAVGGGLLAFLGSLAFSAMKNRPAAQAPDGADAPPLQLPPEMRAPETPEEEQRQQDTALLAIRAMINAAKADGAIDGGEMGRIMGKLGELGTDGSARDFVMNELQKPLDTDGLVQSVTSPEVAVQVYGASLLAIEVDTPAECEYIRTLAAKLGLDAETLAHVHETLGVAPPLPA